MFTRAIVRPPAPNFAAGLTTVDLGAPVYKLALEQHAAYCQALERCGLTVTNLTPDSDHPDSTFVEDTAIVTERGGVITRPGAQSRAGEVESIRIALLQFYPSLLSIELPGTVDGGDVCEAGDHFFIGISARTNEAGARQLAKHLATLDYRASPIDIRNVPGILHLKSGVSFLGDGRLAIIGALAERAEFEGYDTIVVTEPEAYAANCVRINQTVLVAAGYPRFKRDLRLLSYEIDTVDMSEFQKMDGGLSCLSLRF
jgi:dimethylargininase